MSTEISKLDALTFVNETEMISSIDELCNSTEGTEEFLGVQFAFEDGTYSSDGCPDGADEDDWECQEIDITKYRKVNDGVIGFPKTFPATLIIIKLSYSAGSANIYARWAEDKED